MSTRSELIQRLDALSLLLISDRKQSDINDLVTLEKLVYDDLDADEKTFISSPQKGAYNPEDRNRVSEFCNKLFELMNDIYGNDSPGFTVLPENWGSIKDPTQAQLKTYINSILALRNRWYSLLSLSNKPSISQIYTGISLATANNIEKALGIIYKNIKEHYIPAGTVYSGQLFGPSASHMVVSGGLILYTGVNNGNA